ncbi:unnamed protein product, partial [Polarella glacialis]
CPLLYFLPKFTLAAIVVSSVIKLVDFNVAVTLYKVKKNDFAMWFVSFGGTVVAGPMIGICMAVFLSLAVVIFESVRPQITILWRAEGTGSYRSVEQ